MTQERSVEEDSTPIEDVLGDLTGRANTLMSELEEFRQYLRGIKQEQHIEVAHFRNTVKSELNMLQRLALRMNDTATQHIARSSNLPFLETTWQHAKRSKDLTALHKRLYFNSSTKSLSQATDSLAINDATPRRDLKNAAVTVDAITDRGMTWSKVSLVNSNRLLFDLAKQGWTGTSDDDASDDEGYGGGYQSDDDADIPLLKTTKELCRAARSFRVRTRTPQVNLILPRLRLGESDAVDAILEDCRRTGAKVHCGSSDVPLPVIDSAFRSMVPNPMDRFSEILNIDCTILLAIVSDFSHAKVSKEAWFHTALQRQVEIEGNENLLPSLLYPALGSHKMVCTKEAADRMREIVNTLGTPSETARTRILMGDDISKSRENLIQELQEWSAYEVPPDLKLPIEIVDQNTDDCQARLPPEAAQAGPEMTPINQSVFLYGWATACTTITSNRAVVKQLENHLERYTDLDPKVYPSIWLCPTARSLVGKEKRGTKKEEKDGAWPLPDPLRREQQRRNGLDVLSKRAGHEVEDLRPNGYACAEVIEAKNASTQDLRVKRSSVKCQQDESSGLLPVPSHGVE